MRMAIPIAGALALSACTPPEPIPPVTAPTPADAAVPEQTPAPPPAPSDPGAAPSVETVGAVVECMRSPADIMAVFGKHSQPINKCLVSGQKRKRLTKGTRIVDLEFRVMPSGRVEAVQVQDRDTRDNSVEACIRRSLRTVRFPAAKGGPCPVALPLSVALPTRPKHRR